jgi:hypothetical protein
VNKSRRCDQIRRDIDSCVGGIETLSETLSERVVKNDKTESNFKLE